MTVARVLPNITGLDRHFDYLVPERFAERVQIGTMVRVPLHGRRVGGWVLGLFDAADPESAAGTELKDITGVTGAGPDASVIACAEWAARRWAGRRRHFLVAASPERAVSAVAHDRRTGRTPGPTSPASARLLEAGGGMLRLPPNDDPLPAILSAVGHGPTLVVLPSVEQAGALGARLRSSGLTVAVHPEEWAAAAGGVDVVVGARSAAWAPCPDLAAGVVVDEHDEALQSEASPTWHARDVVVQRCRAAGAPFLLLSPAPTVTGLAAGPLERPPFDRERRSWPVVEVVDRTGEEPWKRSLLTSPLIGYLRDHSRRVVCVTNVTGRARLLACRSCHQLTRCERCGAAVRLTDAGVLVCPRCAEQRPPVCLHCGASAFANLRPGVTRLREELEAAAGRAAATIIGNSAGPIPDAGVLVGTEAVLHRVTSADVVAFVDFDRELLAPRYRAAEHAMALLVRAARLAGARSRGGRIVIQTFLPHHDVIRAALLGDPGRVVEAETARRRELGLPPFMALATVSGAGSDEFAASLIGAMVGNDGAGRYVVKAPTFLELGDVLRAGRRPPGARLRIAVDPPDA